ncbi:auxin-responsive protein SAUR68-like [Asparagus officinalis]|uniref:auxin-responsive protein SAUR68-like n=1 Tax=Asparagus officinalis TaxID=4686 RepID=UPI00098E56FA|nr:auxin-responsive protein SAUR68-like [Asparagus officinalis]
MINSKKFLQMVKKWQKMAILGRRRIIQFYTCQQEPVMMLAPSDNCNPSIANRGHPICVFLDGKRFMIPLSCLSHSLLRELFRLSEEEYGLPSNGPITLPCDASCKEHIISLVRCEAYMDAEEPGRCSRSPTSLRQQNRQLCLSVSVYDF